MRCHVVAGSLSAATSFFYRVPVSWQDSSDISWRQGCVFLQLPGAETVPPLALLASVKMCLQLTWVQGSLGGWTLIA